MIITGIDIIEIQRINDAVERWGNRFLERIYTDNEISYCRGRMPSLAARFAAKEGTMKALGTGIRGVRWRDVEVVRERSKAPTIRLHGGAAHCASRRPGDAILLGGAAHCARRGPGYALLLGGSTSSTPTGSPERAAASRTPRPPRAAQRNPSWC